MSILEHNLTDRPCRFAGINLSRSGADTPYQKVIDDVTADDKPRTAFLKACLSKLGLVVNEEEQPVPSLSRLHLSSHCATDVSELVAAWNDIITLIEGEEYIKGENDTFHLEKPASWSMATVKDVVETISSVTPGTMLTKQADTPPAAAMEYDQVVKTIIAHDSNLPTYKETPHFNHAAYYSNLNDFRKTSTEEEGDFGKYLLYGEVVTSTNTILEKSAINTFCHS